MGRPAAARRVFTRPLRGRAVLGGKVALVTGASSGIGRATASSLARAGARVAVGARRLGRLDSLVAEIESAGGEALARELDVADRAQCDAFAEAAIAKWGRIDILVNNAGLMPLSFVKNLKVDEWDRMVDVNIKGVLYCTAAVVGHMRERGSGHIVNMSSVAGRIVFPAGSVYCATKHAVTAFTEGLRQELSARSGIRVTSVEPGVVATELTDTITDESLAGFVEGSKKMAALQADDIARAVVYAVEQPDHVSINEVLVRPTVQER